MNNPHRSLVFVLCAVTLPAAAAAPSLPSSAQIKRGEYIVKANGCADCHAPWKMGQHGPEPDLSRGLVGHPQEMAMPQPPKLEGPWLWVGAATNTAFAGPWGVSYASNLTPDPETGIGRWRPEDFIKSLRTGRHAGVGRQLMPPMPWPAYRNYSDVDLKAMYYYLRSQPAVKNRVPEYRPPGAAR